jgi:hypothetical protein
VDTDDKIFIPVKMCSKAKDLSELVDEEVRDFMVSRAILAPKNEDVDRINAIASSRLHCIGADGQRAPVVELLSVDSVLEEETAAAYPPEFLNKLEFSGLPPHMLRIQEGAPVILETSPTALPMAPG